VGKEEFKVELQRTHLILPDTSLGAQQEEKKELLMECSHFVDPVAISGRKAGDR